MDITELTVHELQEKIKSKELTITEITKAYVEKINEKEKDIEAFVTPLTEDAISKAEEIQSKIEEGELTEYSYFKKTKNPHNINKVPGGSSGGSAAAVAANMVPWAIRIRYRRFN